jgi:hypothetical protein
LVVVLAGKALPALPKDHDEVRMSDDVIERVWSRFYRGQVTPPARTFARALIAEVVREQLHPTPSKPTSCIHDWKPASHPAVKGGFLCTKCPAFKP